MSRKSSEIILIVSALNNEWIHSSNIKSLEQIFEKTRRHTAHSENVEGLMIAVHGELHIDENDGNNLNKKTVMNA
jgi:hypothetical protein